MGHNSERNGRSHEKSLTNTCPSNATTCEDSDLSSTKQHESMSDKPTGDPSAVFSITKSSDSCALAVHRRQKILVVLCLDGVIKRPRNYYFRAGYERFFLASFEWKTIDVVICSSKEKGRLQRCAEGQKKFIPVSRYPKIKGMNFCSIYEWPEWLEEELNNSLADSQSPAISDSRFFPGTFETFEIWDRLNQHGFDESNTIVVQNEEMPFFKEIPENIISFIPIQFYYAGFGRYDSKSFCKLLRYLNNLDSFQRESGIIVDIPMYLDVHPDDSVQHFHSKNKLSWGKTSVYGTRLKEGSNIILANGSVLKSLRSDMIPDYIKLLSENNFSNGEEQDSNCNAGCCDTAENAQGKSHLTRTSGIPSRGEGSSSNPKPPNVSNKQASRGTSSDGSNQIDVLQRNSEESTKRWKKNKYRRHHTSNLPMDAIPSSSDDEKSKSSEASSDLQTRSSDSLIGNSSPRIGNKGSSDVEDYRLGPYSSDDELEDTRRNPYNYSHNADVSQVSDVQSQNEKVKGTEREGERKVVRANLIEEQNEKRVSKSADQVRPITTINNFYFR